MLQYAPICSPFQNDFDGSLPTLCTTLFLIDVVALVEVAGAVQVLVLSCRCRRWGRGELPELRAMVTLSVEGGLASVTHFDLDIVKSIGEMN